MALSLLLDERLARRVLLVDRDAITKRAVRLALECRRDVRLVGECDDGEAAAARIERDAVDIVLLDADSPDVDALALIRRVRVEAMPIIIAFASLDRLASVGFEFAAVDCLVKPLSDERLSLAVDRALARCEELRALRGLDQLNGSAGVHSSDHRRVTRPSPSERVDGTHRRLRTRFLVSVGLRATVIHTDDIAWIRATGCYATFVMLDGKELLVRLPLDQLEGELDPDVFIRIHRSAIVKLVEIRGLERTAARTTVAILRSGARIPVSRPRREPLISALGGR